MRLFWIKPSQTKILQLKFLVLIKNMKIMSNYHYTKACHLPSILKDGIIKTSKNFLDRNEKPATWLTKSPEWDVACNIGKVLNADDFISGHYYSTDQIDLVPVNNEYMKNKIGMCRILVSEDLQTISWAKFRYVSGISESSYTLLDRHCRNIGSPVEQWLCTFRNIPSKYWEGIEMFVDDQWVKWDEKISIEKFIDLCLSCNGNYGDHCTISNQSYKISENQKDRKLRSNGISKEDCQKQIDFMNAYRDDIAVFWEANKHRKGYIAVHVTDDYKLYDCGLIFKEKRVKKSTFYPSLWKSRTENFALVHFFWEATFTQYRMAFAYDLENFESFTGKNN
jgi:hypothetical protein